MSVTVLVEPGELTADRLQIEGDTYHHLFRVRRLDREIELRLVDGEGGARAGRVVDIDRERAVVEIGASVDPCEPEIWIEVAVAPPRPERASWLVEKGTELGVSAFRFVRSQRAVREYGEGRLARLERVARTAVEQCGRARLPAITGLHELRDVATQLADFDACWLLRAKGPAPPESAADAGRRLALIVGPEGGWTTDEVEDLVAAGARSVSLGSRVLRVETAVVAAASLALCR